MNNTKKQFNLWGKQLGILILATSAANAFAGYQTTFVKAVSDDGSEYVLADSTKKTVYTFDNDPAEGAPACNGKCAEIWPPILLSDEEAARTVAPFGVVVRATGLKQLTHNGKALYNYFLDRKPGDLLGDGIGGVWHDVHQDIDVAGCKLADFVEVDNATINASFGFFTPKCLRVKKGTSVTINASNSHPVSSMNDVLGFANPLRNLGRQTTKFSQQFLEPGIFGFFCEHHGDINGSGMAGAIEVVE